MDIVSEKLEASLLEAEAAIEWRGQTDEKLACLDSWTFAKVRRVEQALISIVSQIREMQSV
jgi:hypothetical protein